MTRRLTVLVILAGTTFLTLLAIAGHSPLTGRRILSVTADHGLNSGDLLPLAAWACVAACCVALWREPR